MGVRGAELYGSGYKRQQVPSCDRNAGTFVISVFSVDSPFPSTLPTTHLEVLPKTAKLGLVTFATIQMGQRTYYSRVRDNTRRQLVEG